MIDRRTFIGALGSSLAVPPLLWGEESKPRRLAMVTTEWRYPSHAWHMGERFPGGISRGGTVASVPPRAGIDLHGPVPGE